MDKKIILYGTGLRGEKFYQKWKNRISIDFCVDRRNQEKFHGLEVLAKEEMAVRFREHLIVVAAVPDICLEIRQELKELGFHEFRDFICDEAYGRRLAVVYGNCHMQILTEYLRNNPYFSRKYFVIQKLIYVEDPEIWPDDHMLQALRLLIMQDIRENNYFGAPSEKWYRAHCGPETQVITIPNLYGFNFMFPQILARGGQNQELLEERRKRHLWSRRGDKGISFVVNILSREERVIDELYAAGADIQEMERVILQDDVFEAEEIRKDFAETLTALKERESRCDIRISDYIESAYQEIQLFYDPSHPTNAVIYEKGRRILKILDLPVEESMPVFRRLDPDECFVYGCVKKALGMKWEQKFIRASGNRKIQFPPVSLRDYIEEYIAWNYEDDREQDCREG